MRYYIDTEFLEGTQNKTFLEMNVGKTKPTIENKFYLYRHIRTDKNEVFYIGIGSKRTDNNYSRAYSKNLRNYHWENIVKKTKYNVEILFETNDRNLIIEKEKEFIKLYGRSDLHLGTLCNLTDGGEGSVGTIVKDSTRKLHSIRSKNNKYRLGIPHSEETKLLMSESRIGNKHPMYGKKHSNETIEKFKLAQTGSKKSNITIEKHKQRALLPNQCNRKPCILFDLTSNDCWEAISITELSKKCPLSLSTIKKLKKGLSVTNKYKKYKFTNL